MSIVMSRPRVDELGEAVAALRGWQHDAIALQLHPGDLGWNFQYGAARTAAAVRLWRRDGQVVAVGFLDEPGLIRMGIAPEVEHDDDVADQMAGDLTRPQHGVLPQEEADVEARFGAALRARLRAEGWTDGEPWTPLFRDLTEPVEPPGVRIEVVDAVNLDAEQVRLRSAVHRASFGRSTFTDERWYAMASGPAYADARCLIAFDRDDNAVAAATVWSAGPGRPGLLEPLGVHADHRGHGHGRAISLAAAATLRELGCSSARVGTPSANVGAVATYRSAGFEQQPDAADLHRSA